MFLMMASGIDGNNGFLMSPEQIFITDVGTDSKDNAFYWVSIGGYVYDHKWNEITLQRLERSVDPNDVMNPVILRGHLWKTVPTRFWQVDDGHQLGPMPSQPGLDARLSSIYYGDRRARQAAHWADASVDHVEQSPQGMRQDLYAEKAPTRRHRVRRTKSCNGLLRENEELPSHCERQAGRQRSVDRICFPRPDLLEQSTDGLDEAVSTSTLVDTRDRSEIESHITHYARKAYVGPDSGVGIGSDGDDDDNDDDDNDDEWRLEFVENRSLDRRCFRKTEQIADTLGQMVSQVVQTKTSLQRPSPYLL